MGCAPLSLIYLLLLFSPQVLIRHYSPSQPSFYLWLDRRLSPRDSRAEHSNEDNLDAALKVQLWSAISTATSRHEDEHLHSDFFLMSHQQINTITLIYVRLKALAALLRLETSA